MIVAAIDSTTRIRQQHNRKQDEKMCWTIQMKKKKRNNLVNNCNSNLPTENYRANSNNKIDKDVEKTPAIFSSIR